MTLPEIKEVRAEKYDLGFKQALSTALHTVTETHNVLIEVELESGTVGLGEAVPSDSVTGENRETVLAVCEDAKEEIEGEPVSAYRRIHRKLRKNFDGQTSAIAGLEIAVLDALCKELDCSLADFVGGENQEVKTDYTIMIGDEEETREKAEEAVEAGFEELKVKIGEDVEEDVETLKTVQDAAPEADLKVDANQGYTVKEAIRFDRKLREEGIELELFEQPTREDDFRGLKEVKEKIEVPVAADESLHTKEDAARLAEMDAADIFNIKLMKAGPVEALDIISIAESYNIELMIGCMAESAVSIQAGAQIVSGTGAFQYVDLDAPFFLEDEWIETEFTPEIETRGPGLGIEADDRE
jgi:L-alanine-DL-glutamate epimerase-like enolase superfamily enzyme